MMQAADPRQRENLRSCGRTRLYGPPVRRLLAQCFVSTVVVTAGQVFVCEPLQMLLIERDYVIRHFPATASHPALSDAVLPWTPDAGANWSNAARLQKLDDVAAQFGIGNNSPFVQLSGLAGSVPPTPDESSATRRRMMAGAANDQLTS